MIEPILLFELYNSFSCGTDTNWSACFYIFAMWYGYQLVCVFLHQKDDNKKVVDF